ncbi:MAG: hypothetical protein MUF62_10375 [Chitinophagaceae bacterium]|nr:hypothetical protein [Chitinophagaceae bacterium]
MRHPLHSLLLAIVLLAPACLLAQHYITAAGLRVGSGIGATVQQRIVGSFTVEGMVQQSLGSQQTVVTALFQKHQRLAGKAFNLYLGAGPHLGFWKTNLQNESGERITQRYAGISAIAGIELTLGRTLLSADFKPMLSKGGPAWLDAQTGISVRYVLFKELRKKQPRRAAQEKRPKRKLFG